MAKLTWKPGNMIYPVPAVLVTCGNSTDNYNAITIAWTGTICTNPPMTYISVRPSRYSYNLIKDSGEFVINLTTEDLVFATDFCGVRSGRDMDKIEEMKLTLESGDHVKAPLIKESPVNIECKVTEIKELGSHHMFIAKVLAVHVDDEYLDEYDKFHLDQANPICYSHGQYYALGRPLGKFGFSVSKKKKKKNHLSKPEKKTRLAANKKNKNKKTKQKSKN
ncbi:flavin reductase family protein [Vallitalea okinawensis]|uniref:flavin reductase family protein n=1 Tax=Vallitalea okinawensis TaxID=2078660 RepID=UPI000CFDDAE9|nr:flavin reductase family protein [Vallitalea okinawensis]